MAHAFTRLWDNLSRDSCINDHLCHRHYSIPLNILEYECLLYILLLALALALVFDSFLLFVLSESNGLFFSKSYRFMLNNRLWPDQMPLKIIKTCGGQKSAKTPYIYFNLYSTSRHLCVIHLCLFP